MSQRNLPLFLFLCVLMVAAFVLQLVLGSVSIPLADILKVLGGGHIENETWRNIILEARLPGAIAAVLAGAGLSVSGLQMQAMFRNPVAGPYVLGISAGASLGVALLLLAGSFFGGMVGLHLLSSWSVIAAAAVGATAIFLINFFISFRLNDVVAFLIIGLMIGGGIGALIEVLQSVSGNEALKQYVLWTFGSFRYVSSTQVMYLSGMVGMGIGLTFFLSKPMNLLLLGDSYATSSGLDVRKTKLFIVFTTSILAGSITAFCGPIGFVGLAVPHVARALFKTSDHKILIPATMVIGAIITCLCNVAASAPGSDFVLPVNAITSLLGAPVVIWIIVRQKKL